MKIRSLFVIGIGFATALSGFGQARADEDKSGRSLFNGKDLQGWVPINVAAETFTVRDGMIVSTGKPKGMLRTDRPFENFIVDLEWRFPQPGGNAGVFIWGDALPAVGKPYARGIEVQILDHAYAEKRKQAGQPTDGFTTHGDVFAIQGATLTPDRPHPKGAMRSLPSESRSRPSPEWNQYRITCRDGTIKLAVNGKEVSGGSDCVPRKGYLCLEAEGAECHFRNIRIQELPSSNPTESQTALLDPDFTSLYSGLNLQGWRQDPGHSGHWTAKDSILAYDGKSEAKDKSLWTEKEYGDFVMVVDWRLPGKPTPKPRAVILPNGDDAVNPDGTKKVLNIPYAGDSGILIRGSEKRKSTSPATPWARVSSMAIEPTKKCPPRSAPPPSRRSRPTRLPASGTGSSSPSRETA
ncbi:family 16 glycoside hydrolase [Singulisphaera sp. Ch08]|uniref:Family 16 glycoside hydrolase n=1 Tax=Singulisphaera sp. Ch08 TaxID=3120278 RepID=A0AAU7C7R6_9BACT